MIWLIGNKGMLGSKIEQLLINNNLNIIKSDKEIDITDLRTLKKFTNNQNISWIINCSAYTAVDKAEEEKNLAYKINAEGILNICQIAKDKKARLIHISTDYVFDGNKKVPYHEDDKTNPLGIYGLSKLAGENNIIKNYDKFFIIRTSWLYGENGKNFVATILKFLNEKSQLKIINDQFGCPTYTKDLAELIYTIINQNSNKYGIYHFSNENITTWYKFTLKIYEISKKFKIIDKDVEILPITTDQYPTKAKRPIYSVLSKDKVKKTFNINIRSWDDALKEYIKNLK